MTWTQFGRLIYSRTCSGSIFSFRFNKLGFIQVTCYSDTIEHRELQGTYPALYSGIFGFESWPEGRLSGINLQYEMHKDSRATMWSKETRHQVTHTQQYPIRGWYIEKLYVHSIYLRDGDPTNLTPSLYSVLEIFVEYGLYTNRKSSTKFQVSKMVKTLQTTCNGGGGNHCIMERITLCSSEMMTTTLQNTRCHNPQDNMNKIICLKTTKISTFVWCIPLHFRLQLNIPTKNPVTAI